MYNYRKILTLIVVCIGAAAHQAWKANLFTIVSDMFKKNGRFNSGHWRICRRHRWCTCSTFVGRLIDHFKGIGEAAATAQYLVGNAALSVIQGYVQTAYAIMFALCGFAYLIAWVIMKALVPKFKLITDL